MSSSSVNSAIRDGLRFRNIDCDCGKRASVRILESSLNKNKLYYCCAANRCGFFSLMFAPLTNDLAVNEWMRYHKQQVLNP
jgi:hypothetical protein